MVKLADLPKYHCCSHCDVKYCPDGAGHYVKCKIKDCQEGNTRMMQTFALPSGKKES